MQRSGVTRQTIHFYLRKGLLPKPRRTSRTYALYSPETVDLLELIKECQSGLRLSLDEIVKMFMQANYDPRQIRSELERRNSTPRPSQPESGDGHRALTQNDVLAMLQPPPPPRWLEDLRRRGVVNGRGEKYSPETAELIRSVWSLCQLGVELDDLKDVVKQIEEEAEVELAAFRRVLDPKRRAKGDYATAIRSLNAFEQFVDWKRKDALKTAFFHKMLRSGDTFVGPNQKRVIPSETFLVKMGLNREIDRLLNELDKDPEDRRSLQGLARAYYMRSDWLSLFGVSEKILQMDPLDVRAMADQTRAMYYLGRIDEAVARLEHRLHAGSDPLLKFRLGQSLVLRSQNGSISDFFNALIRKQILTAEALQEARDQPSVRRWITLDRALDNLSVSDPLHLNQPTIEELEALHEEYQSIPAKGLSALSKMSLAIGKILATYALYLVYRRHHRPRAEQLRRKIVQMDPHGVLATRSQPNPAVAPAPAPRGRSKAALQRVG
jgi:DNA-binding transcriptional MerR regulator/tetratricopeptide (TPR) repeat protein